jgi:hypothetical protein
MEEAYCESNKRIDGLMIEIKRLGTTIRRIARHPVALRVGVEGTVDVAMLQECAPASLSQRPTDIYVLWKEYEFGIRGLKPANEFMTRERGASRAGFSHREVFWEIILDLIHLGYTNETVIIYKIYLTYVRDKSVTDILTLIRADKVSWGPHV